MNVKEIIFLLKDATIIDIVGNPIDGITLLLVLANKNKSQLHFKVGGTEKAKWIQSGFSFFENILHSIEFNKVDD